jgi:WD40 repeat protein
MRCISEKRHAFTLIDLLLAVALLGAVLAFFVETGSFLNVRTYNLSHLCLSDSGNRYAAIDGYGSIGDIHVWQRSPRKLLATIPGPSYDYLDDPIALSPQGRFLAFYDRPSSGNSLSLWNVDTQTQISHQLMSVEQMEFSPDEAAVACLLNDGTIDVLKTHDGSLRYKLNAGTPRRCTAMTWSPDGKQIAARVEGELTFWSTAVGNANLGAIAIDHSPDYRSLKFSPNGQYIAVGTYYYPNCGGRINKSRIDLYDLATRQSMGSWEQPEQSFDRLVFLQHGKILAFTTDELHFLEVPSLDEVKTYPTIKYANGPWALGEEQVGLGLADTVYGINLDGSVDEDALGIHHARTRHGKNSAIFLLAIILINLAWQIHRAIRRKKRFPAAAPS